MFRCLDCVLNLRFWRRWSWLYWYWTHTKKNIR